ncbi:helix-turn-helix transcriptional regulator [Amycolatopsis sp. NPDC004378]
MADTSRRALHLLSLLATRRQWSLSELAARLEVSERTVRRDVETLRQLGYAIDPLRGPSGGYRLGTGLALPPLLFDDEQALAIAVALQTAPSTVFGLGDDAARALDVLKQVMPAKLRSAMDELRLTKVHNYWEFAAPPITPEPLKAVGNAVRQRQLLVIDILRPDGTRPQPRDDDFAPPQRLEPHHLVVWAGRWYVVGYDLGLDRWSVIRVDRIRISASIGTGFSRRELPGDDVAQFVMKSHDRGDTPAEWGCIGRARLRVPAATVARWAPGGSVVEQLGPEHSRLTVSAWSWAGIAGILATFDAELSEVEPAELVDACRRLREKWAALA